MSRKIFTSIIFALIFVSNSYGHFMGNNCLFQDMTFEFQLYNHYYLKADIPGPEKFFGIEGNSAFNLELNCFPEKDCFWNPAIGKDVQESVDIVPNEPLTKVSPTSLPCNINENLTLTKENSPYFIDCNVEIQPNVLLKIEKGVDIVFLDSVSIYVYGELSAEGTSVEPITFKPSIGIGGWGKIINYHATGLCLLKYVTIINGSLDASYSEVTLENFYLSNDRDLNSSDGLFTSFGCKLQILKSKFIGNNTGEGLIFKYPETAHIESCYFRDVPDAVELQYINGGVVKNNIIINPHDDGIDLNYSENAIVTGNKVYNAFDNGVTFDSCQNIMIEKNLIVGCLHGINLANNTHATCLNNTLYGNEKSIFLHQKNEASGGGHINILNTILSTSTVQVISADQYSSFSISFSLCDTQNFTGNENIFDDPLFVSVADSNFQLQPDSPGINAGDPQSVPDPDGTRSDVGAYFFNFGIFNVVLNEINYKSAVNFDAGDWVEIYNADENTADISGWTFKDEDDAHTFDIPFNTVLQPGGFLVLCENISLFRQQHPNVENVTGNFLFGLSSTGEAVRLFNHTGNLVDSVLYSGQSPWPVEPNGQGPTLELKNPLLDNTLSESWAASSLYGTPGAINSSYISGIFDGAGADFGLNVFPNPAKGNCPVQIDFDSPNAGIVVVKIFDYSGKLVFELPKEYVIPGKNSIKMKEILIQGLYLISISFADNRNILTQKLIKISH